MFKHINITGRGGWPSIFREKKGGDRVQGNISKRGSVRFEHARRRLAKLAGREPERTSDADVIEALALGWAATRAYLRATRGEEK